MSTGPAEQRSLFDQAGGMWSTLSRELRVSIAAIGLAVVAAAGYMLATASRVDASKVPLLEGAQFTRQERIAALRAFASTGLSGAEVSGNMILVPSDRHGDFVRAIPDHAVPGNLDADLDEYVENDTWWKSRDESRRQFLMYTARKISREIKLFPEVVDASVTVTQPPPMGLRRIGEAKASVTIETVGGRPLSPIRVREVQNLVAHAFDKLQPANVYVVANAPVDRGLTGDDGPIDTKFAEYDDRALQTKEAYRKTIEHHLRRALAHLPGATVVANVEVHPTRDIYQRIVSYDKGVPKTTDSTILSEETPQAAAIGGPPGVRTNVDAPPTVPNQGVAATAATATKTDETSSTVFNNNVMETTQRGQDFQPRLVGVVVNVPRELLQATATAGPEGEETIQEAAATEQDIIDAVLSLNYPGLTPEMVKVVRTVLPEPLPPDEAPAVTFELLRNYGMEIFLGLLAAAAVLTAFLLARRAPMPELVRTVSDEDLNKELKEESSTEMEMDEAAARFGKMQESLVQVVSKKPEAAAGLIKRWIHQDE